MPFRISGLDAQLFTGLFALSDAELAAKRAVRMIADRTPGFPCRVSLEDAERGETVLLVNHEHLPGASPYRASHAVFVREGVTTARPAVGEIPEVFRRRLLSVRAFDGHDMMIEAEVVDGTEVAPVIERMFAAPSTAFIHLHNAKPGCWAARVDRA